MHAWLKQHFPKVDKKVDQYGYWVPFLGSVWGGMSYAASSMPSISQYGWGAVVFVGLGVSCLAMLAVSASLALYRYFNPLAAQATPDKPTRLSGPVVDPKDVVPHHETWRGLAETSIRNLNRSTFLVVTSAIQEIYRRRLMGAVDFIPRGQLPFDTDEKLRAETGRIDEFISDLQANLVGSHWIAALERRYRDAESAADHMLLSAEIPSGLNVVLYRRFVIASMRRDYIETWLTSAITEAKSHESQMLQMLRERPEFHSKS